ncbi:MAG: Enamidase, partial [Deltaproteobacteria bacterium]|nr:Enamidase [Deltaproteobacteria bacterium]
MSKVILKNIGTIISGDIAKPILEGNAILVEESLIKDVGRFEDIQV